MNVIYFFCESTAIRIPYFGYDRDRRLMRLLISQGGIWNEEQYEFIIKQKMSAEQLTGIFPDFPCVWVEEKSPVQIRVFNFREHPWRTSSGKSSNGNGNTNNAGIFNDIPDLPMENISQNELNPTVFAPTHLPEKFSVQWRIRLEAELRSRKYSPRTQRSYLFYNCLLCNMLQKTPEEINPEDITIFLASIEKDREYSSSSMNLALSAIKFFYKRVLKKDIVNTQSRPRHDKNLPMVLSKTEILRILTLERNIKHRLLLMLVYSSGLRVSEVVSLKREHVDISRGIIYVMQGKGRKDRCTILSQKAVGIFNEYLSSFRPQSWLFPGQPANHHLSIRSAQKIFDKAIHKAEIRKKISIHSLRHTFATHLLESGTDIRYIQALLGHSSLRTTERYTHIAHSSILNIQSPLDTIL